MTTSRDPSGAIAIPHALSSGLRARSMRSPASTFQTTTALSRVTAASTAPSRESAARRTARGKAAFSASCWRWSPRRASTGTTPRRAAATVSQISTCMAAVSSMGTNRTSSGMVPADRRLFGWPARSCWPVLSTVLQRRTSPFLAAEISVSSAVNASATGACWLARKIVVSADRSGQMRTVPSMLAVAARSPCARIETEKISSVWPRRTRTFSLPRSHTRAVPSSLPETMNSSSRSKANE